MRRAGWEPHPVGRVRAGPWGVSGRLRVSAPHPQPHPGLSPARLQMKWRSRGPGPHSGGGRGHQRWVRAPLCVCHGQNLDQEVVAWFRLVTTGACPVFHSRAMLSSGGSSLQSVGPSRHPWQEPPLSPQASPALPGHPLHPRHPPDAPAQPHAGGTSGCAEEEDEPGAGVPWSPADRVSRLGGSCPFVLIRGLRSWAVVFDAGSHVREFLQHGH